MSPHNAQWLGLPFLNRNFVQGWMFYSFVTFQSRPPALFMALERYPFVFLPIVFIYVYLCVSFHTHVFVCDHGGLKREIGARTTGYRLLWASTISTGNWVRSSHLPEPPAFTMPEPSLSDFFYITQFTSLVWLVAAMLAMSSYTSHTLVSITIVVWTRCVLCADGPEVLLLHESFRTGCCGFNSVPLSTIWRKFLGPTMNILLGSMQDQKGLTSRCLTEGLRSHNPFHRDRERAFFGVFCYTTSDCKETLTELFLVSLTPWSRIIT